MALDDMSSVSTGVSQKGKEDIKQQIQIDLVQDASNELDNNGDVKEALQACWSGQDCEQFIKNLDTMVTDVKEALSKYNEEIGAKLDEVYDQWVQFQSTHVSGS